MNGDTVTGCISWITNDAIEGGRRSVRYQTERMMWEFRHVIAADGVTTCGDVAPVML